MPSKYGVRIRQPKPEATQRPKQHDQEHRLAREVEDRHPQQAQGAQPPGQERRQRGGADQPERERHPDQDREHDDGGRDDEPPQRPDHGAPGSQGLQVVADASYARRSGPGPRRSRGARSSESSWSEVPRGRQHVRLDVVGELAHLAGEPVPPGDLERDPRHLPRPPRRLERPVDAAHLEHEDPGRAEQRPPGRPGWSSRCRRRGSARRRPSPAAAARVRRRSRPRRRRRGRCRTSARRPARCWPRTPGTAPAAPRT